MEKGNKMEEHENESFYIEAYDIDKPLVKVGKRYYLPEKIFCDALSNECILVNNPTIGVTSYSVHKNKDGSMWINGFNIAKCYDEFVHMDDVPGRLFLTEEMIERLSE